MIIAIDGPAAAGKGTLARRLAETFGLAHMDTGGLYRAVAWHLLRAGDARDENAAVAATRRIGLDDLARPDLRDEAVGALSSVVAAMPRVRQALLRRQRDFARRPPDGTAGAVLDGRDIGTVVCPDADLKLFVTASLDARSRRRHGELVARGAAVTLAAVRRDLEIRDARDSGRATAPTRAAPDAHLLDTTNLDIDAAFEVARRLVAQHLEQQD